MSQSRSRRVLAIGIDAAEPTLVRKLIDEGKLPSLEALLTGGYWGEVRSPADIGSGTVWPTFMTGRGPIDHGIYSILPWDSAAMRLVRLTTDHLTPFWEALSRKGYAVGVLDVPFAPVVGLERGIEISEWGAHDRMRGHMVIFPLSQHEWVARIAGDHPLGIGRVNVAGPTDWTALQTLSAECRAGVRLRGALAAGLLTNFKLDLLMTVFPEVHHASHYLWHTLDPADDARALAKSDNGRTGHPTLLEVFREVDRQIGQLADLAGPDAMVLVFSLHGMRRTQGIPTILDPLLQSLGLASVKGWGARTWLERRQSALSAIKQAIPDSLRRLYRKATPRALRPPQPGLQLPYDWARTAAFPVPTDQHGWIRLNLDGREAGGLVARGQYEEVCAQLEQVLRGLVTNRGAKVVTDVLRIGRAAAGPPDRLPDLIVHWDDQALANPLRVVTPAISARATGTAFTGQHAPHGFFILRPASGQLRNPGASIAAQELHQLIRAGLDS
jgi:predicted AlkP superfamily phosphohydrolase/phosphomutase